MLALFKLLQYYILDNRCEWAAKLMRVYGKFRVLQPLPLPCWRVLGCTQFDSEAEHGSILMYDTFVHAVAHIFPQYGDASQTRLLIVCMHLRNEVLGYGAKMGRAGDEK